MKATEINLKNDGFTFNTNHKNGHYKFLMRLGRVLPSTKNQVKYFCQEGICLSILNKEDVERIETLLNKHGFEGEYVYTKNKQSVRLTNHVDLYKALKKEYFNK